MPILHTQAITLRRRRMREADALLTLFTKAYGKVLISTKSVLKTTSRYAGITQPFHHVNVILYAKTEDQDIWTLTQTSLIRSFENIQTDLKRMTPLSTVVEWIDILSESFQSNERIWYLLLDILNRWDALPPREEDLSYVQLQLLCDAGFRPDLSHCQSCHCQRSTRWYYVKQNGSIACSSCAKDGLTISGGSVEILRTLLKQNEPLPSIRISETQQAEIQRFIETHAAYHAGIQSKASSFQSHLQNNPTLSTPTISTTREDAVR